MDQKHCVFKHSTEPGGRLKVYFTSQGQGLFQEWTRFILATVVLKEANISEGFIFYPKDHKFAPTHPPPPKDSF